MMPKKFQHLLFASSFFALTLPCMVACKQAHTDADEPNGEKPRTAQSVMDTTRLITEQISRCARLYTTEVKVHKVVTYSDAPKATGQLLGIPFEIDTRIGDRKIAIPIDVMLKAYIDFEQFGPDNVKRTDSTIVITLPDPHIVATSSKVDHAGTRQYVDGMRSAFNDEEQTALAKQGADSIVSHLSRYGIEERSRQHAAELLIPLLRRMGYKDTQITIRFGKSYDDRRLKQLTTIYFNRS